MDDINVGYERLAELQVCYFNLSPGIQLPTTQPILHMSWVIKLPNITCSGKEGKWCGG
jgi:hypothetical protein